MSVVVLGLSSSPRVPSPVRIISIAWTVVIHIVVVAVGALRPLGLGTRPIVAVLVWSSPIILWSLVSCSRCALATYNK
jgi:hypothetical protein